MDELVGEVEPSPKLHATWSAIDQLLAHVETAGHLYEINLTTMQHALRLIKMLSENEPRFLRAVRFPEDHLEQLKRFLSLLSSYDYDGIDRNRETYFGEQGYIDDLQWTLSQLQDAVPLPRADVDAARLKLQEKKEELTSEMEDMVDEESLSTSKPPSKIESRKRSYTATGFSIKELFATL